MRYYSKRYSS